MMKLDELNTYPFSLPIQNKLTWGIGKGLQSLDHVLVEVKAGGFVGYAEAVPRPSILHETQESVITYCKQITNKLIFDLTEENIDNFSDLEFSKNQNLAAKAAVNCALYDLLSKIKGISLNELIGLPNNKIDSCYVLPKPENDNEYIDQLEDKIAQGIFGFKIKLTGDISRDFHIFDILNKFTGCMFYLDGNEMYSLDNAVKLVDHVSSIPNILYLEEPIDVSNIKGRQKLMEYVKENQLYIEIVGDDSCKTFEDLKKQVDLTTISMVNIKVPRTGISEGLKILDYCKKIDLPVMIGSHAGYLIASYYSCLLANHEAVTSKLNEVIYWNNVSKENDFVERPKIKNNQVNFNNFPKIDMNKIAEAIK
ncbi:hypothetical protein CEE44_01285 [Candidatus Woesearchaeota archaeon B3_Woes]|nr:MAG: hypothetical protein CEE44_01285 [Candidatus Woesearchaeota archaeon B3_Woes]